MKVNGWRDGLQSTKGESTLNTNLVLMALSGHLKASITKCQGVPSPSPRDKRKLNHRLCGFVILSVLAVWLF